MEFVVSYTGMGMSKDEVARAAVPFNRRETARERKIEGTGLSLPLIIRLVKAHGGTLDTESIPEKDTTASVHIPKTEP